MQYPSGARPTAPFLNFTIFLLQGTSAGFGKKEPSPLHDVINKQAMKSWTLEIHEIGFNNECYGCGDFVRGIIECGGKSEECIQ